MVIVRRCEDVVARGRHVPERTCVACGRKRAKSELLRIVRRPDGKVEVDPQQREPGRGAYLCCDESCVARARKRGGLQRALHTAVPASFYDRVTAALQGEDVGD